MLINTTSNETVSFPIIRLTKLSYERGKEHVGINVAPSSSTLAPMFFKSSKIDSSKFPLVYTKKEQPLF